MEMVGQENKSEMAWWVGEQLWEEGTQHSGRTMACAPSTGPGDQIG